MQYAMVHLDLQSVCPRRDGEVMPTRQRLREAIDGAPPGYFDRGHRWDLKKEVEVVVTLNGREGQNMPPTGETGSGSTASWTSSVPAHRLAR